MVAEQTASLVNNGVIATDDSAKFTWDKDLVGCKSVALFIGRGETDDGIGFVDNVSGKDGAVGIILDKTSFYGESGGQIYDTGTIVTNSGAKFDVHNVQTYGQYILHIGVVVEGEINKNESVNCMVNYTRRAPIASNHTMTHVLNFALRDVLVTNAENKDSLTQTVDQKGSLNDDKKLRFDFSWSGPLTAKQLAAVEQNVSDAIKSAIPVQSSLVPLEDAKNVSALRAVFGEVYPDPVRIVAVSPTPVSQILAVPKDNEWNSYSIELCGGTHIKNTKEAQAFVILQEEGIAKGIRRITAITRHDATAAIKAGEAFKLRVTDAGSMDGGTLENEVKTLKADLENITVSAVLKNEMREILAAYGKKVVAWKKEQVAEQTTVVVEKVIAAALSAEGNKVVCRVDFGVNGKIVKAVQAAYGKKIKDKALMIISADVSDDRYMVATFAPKGFEGIDCKAWALSATEGTGGKGGGKKGSAQVTVSSISSIEGVIAKARNF